jgi:LacI family kdg operon repressor
VSARPRANIADVAAAAGVSKATVSRFLNHRERLLSPDIAARVEAAIAALGYSPNPMAQALSHGRSRLVGLIVADITNPFSVAVLRGAERACQEAGYLVMLFNLGNEPGGEREAIDTLAGYRVDGFILNTLGYGGGVVDAVALHGKPAVLVDRRHAGLQADFVSLDNPGAMKLACEHLIAAGYRELLYVTEPQRGVSTRHERAAAFAACMAANAGRVAGTVHENEQGDAEGLDAALDALRRRAESAMGDATSAAVISGNAVITLRVAACVARLGWAFGPGGLGFIGFDEAEWAALVGPGLSAIAQPTDAIGRGAADRLIERLRGLDGPPRELLLAGELIARRSSSRS